MEYMKILYLSLFVGQLDLTTFIGGLFFYVTITSSQSGLVLRPPSAVEAQSLFFGPLLSYTPSHWFFFSCHFFWSSSKNLNLYKACYKKSSEKSINTFPLAFSAYISHLSLDLK